IEEAVPFLIKNDNFNNFIHNLRVDLAIRDDFDLGNSRKLMKNGTLISWHQFDPSFIIKIEDQGWSYWAIYKNNDIEMDQIAKKCFEEIYDDFKKNLERYK
ncbi:MAG: hypothetical protein ABII68_08125, partial [Pseudomonadota bacterium]